MIKAGWERKKEREEQSERVNVGNCYSLLKSFFLPSLQKYISFNFLFVIVICGTSNEYEIQYLYLYRYELEYKTYMYVE